MSIDAKQTVSELMKMAVEFRLCNAQGYDEKYKALQNALYQILEPAVTGNGSGWIGVDLDCTLAIYPPDGREQIGSPIGTMVNRILMWIERGIEVRIFTARATLPDQVKLIKAWCLEHLGRELAVTNQKDFMMIELWDDRAVRVVENTGRRCCEGGSRA